MICQCGHSSCDNKRLLEAVELPNLFPEQHQARGSDGWAGGSSLCASSCPPSLSFTPGYPSWWSACTWTVTAHSTVFSDKDHQSCFALKLHLWAETAQDLIDEQTSCWGSRRRAGKQQAACRRRATFNSHPHPSSPQPSAWIFRHTTRLPQLH